MLCRDAVNDDVWRTLYSLMRWQEVDDFYLVGGTSIALRFGYRESDDIDLFTPKPFDADRLSRSLKLYMPSCSIESVSQGTIIAFESGVKIDILQHLYKTLEPAETLETIRLASLRDISAMKVNALSHRGSKKDFSDLLYLEGKGISLVASVRNFQEKYGDEGTFSAIKSLTYFEDTKDEPDPRYRNGWTWSEVMAQMEVFGRAVQRSYNLDWARGYDRDRGKDDRGY